ncbi:hypothetical protein BGZ51_004019 [Haplosporangium sp. Z 767]|nr:hypothetical protein BGZ51_004019 [Haplosporangium sp. Z 767]KAF9183806.1 hypothetical protein BGZ50_004058 [Haplosporangium sp. Z 11]
MNKEANAGEKKKFQRKVAPSKAPGRLLKKKLRDMERLIKNKDTLKDLPEEVIAETEKKIVEIKKQIEALGPQQSSSSSKSQTSSKPSKRSQEKSENGLKFRELRRAGRKISAFKKQHPSYETSEEESKALADLELDLLYIKHFPKHEEYISIYPDSPLTDEELVKKRAEIKDRIAKALASGEIKKSSGPIGGSKQEETTKTSTGKHPASNWSDDDSGEDNEDDECGNTDEHEDKKQRME